MLTKVLKIVCRDTPETLEKLAPGGVFVDGKAFHDATALRAAGYSVWRL